MNLDPFHWLEDSTVSISVSGTSAAGALLKVPTGRVQIRFHNRGTVPVHIRKGTSSAVTALTTDMALAAGSVEVFTLNNNPASPITHVAAITDSGTATLDVTTGAGI
jgi:hypothetical protein